MKRKRALITLERSLETSDNEICSEHSKVLKAKKKKSHVIFYTSSES